MVRDSFLHSEETRQKHRRQNFLPRDEYRPQSIIFLSVPSIAKPNDEEDLSSVRNGFCLLLGHSGGRSRSRTAAKRQFLPGKSMTLFATAEADGSTREDDPRLPIAALRGSIGRSRLRITTLRSKYCTPHLLQVEH